MERQEVFMASQREPGQRLVAGRKTFQMDKYSLASVVSALEGSVELVTSILDTVCVLMEVCWYFLYFICTYLIVSIN